MRDVFVGDVKRPLLFLAAAVGLVWLIACVNVGNLLLGRAMARQHELIVRTALGAGTWRLVSQVIAEAFVLAMAGGAAGAAIAWFAAPILAAMVPAEAQIVGLDHLRLNPIVLAFAGAASLAAAVVFSAISCLGLSVRSHADGLHTTRRSTMTRAAGRSASWLVIAEIALAAMLLVGAGLTLRSLMRLMSVEPGFRSSNVLMIDIGLPSGRYATSDARRAFYARTLPALEAITGVKDAGAAIVTPLTGNNWTTTFDRVDRPVPKGERPPQVGWQSASAGYFSALGIPLRAGRFFDDHDRLAATPPVIISDEAARQFFPNENPVGRRIHGDAGDAEIVGVVGSVRRVSLADAPRADLYYSFEWDASPSTTLFIRTDGDPLSSLSAVRTVLQNIDPEVTIDRPGSLDGVVRESTAMTRLAMRLLTGFAGLAVALAAIGLYAVMAYGVRRRLRELGTRAALGARPGDLVALILRQGVILAAVGLCIGLLAGMLSARVLSSVLFQVTADDPIVLMGTSLVVLVVTLAACGLPARRAGRVDPARTLASD
jgi:predicted permease